MKREEDWAATMLRYVLALTLIALAAVLAYAAFRIYEFVH